MLIRNKFLNLKTFETMFFWAFIVAFVLGGFVSCNLIDNSETSNGHIIIAPPDTGEKNISIEDLKASTLILDKNSGYIALSLIDTSHWCEQTFIILDTINGNFSKLQYRGTFLFHQLIGSYNITANSKVVFYSKQEKRETDTSWIPNAFPDTFSIAQTNTHYTITQELFGFETTEIYSVVQELRLETCTLAKNTYEVSDIFPCHQTIFEATGNNFVHKEYRPVDGEALLYFEYQGIYSLSNGNFISAQVQKRVEENGSFTTSTYDLTLSNFNSNGFKVSASNYFPTGDSSLFLSYKDTAKKITCFEPPVIPPEDLPTNYYLDSIQTPIFNVRCTPCHGTIETGGAWPLTNISAVVQPWNPKGSSLFSRVLSKEMPANAIPNADTTLGQNRYLFKSELDKIYIWINKGAPGLI